MTTRIWTQARRCGLRYLVHVHFRDSLPTRCIFRPLAYALPGKRSSALRTIRIITSMENYRGVVSSLEILTSALATVRVSSVAALMEVDFERCLRPIQSRRPDVQ